MCVFIQGAGVKYGMIFKLFPNVLSSLCNGISTFVSYLMLKLSL